LIATRKLTSLTEALTVLMQAALQSIGNVNIELAETSHSGLPAQRLKLLPRARCLGKLDMTFFLALQCAD